MDWPTPRKFILKVTSPASFNALAARYFASGKFLAKVLNGNGQAKRNGNGASNGTEKNASGKNAASPIAK